MKRVLCVMFALLFLFPLSACRSQKRTSYQSPVNFYYCTDPVVFNSAEGVISAEVRESKGYDLDSEFVRFVDLYLQGPLSEGYSSPFPEGVTLRKYTRNNDTLEIILSIQISQLTGYDLTIACACLAKTLMELTGAEIIDIHAEGGKMGDAISVTMSAETLLLLDESTAE